MPCFRISQRGFPNLPAEAIPQHAHGFHQSLLDLWIGLGKGLLDQVNGIGLAGQGWRVGQQDTRHTCQHVRARAPARLLRGAGRRHLVAEAIGP